jgi:hypothetical protein
MNRFRRIVAAAAMAAGVLLSATLPGSAEPVGPEDVLAAWYRLSLELVRHTPTYSPPVASRSFAYLGIAAFEATATGSGELRSLAGQLNGLEPVPRREAGAAHDEAAVLQAAMATVVKDLFANTGPTGQRAMSRLEARLRAAVAEGAAPEIVERSEAHGRAVAAHVLAWTRQDGGRVVENMGFPLEWELAEGPGRWVPTSLVRQQQTPLLPGWGDNRTFAMPDGAACSLPAPPEYSEEKDSAFYQEALEVWQAGREMTGEQRAMARFWSDDPMLSVTPPGHWISIALQIMERDRVGRIDGVDLLARLGIALSDAFVACWKSKFEYDVVRPVTYIRRLIDPGWEPLLITPPFPEYPSGHSTQSAAAAAVLTAFFGEGFAFEDRTPQADGALPRRFESFGAAAEEAGMSRLYGGIHFRAAIERGLEQGRCVGGFVNALTTRRR